MTLPAAPATSPATLARRRDGAVGVLAPLVIYGVARALSTVALVRAASDQPATATLFRATDPLRGYFVHSPQPVAPDYATLLTNWDGQWYEYIATSGYSSAAVDSSPEASWAWAFPPGYPLLVRAVMGLTGWSFPWAATILSTLLGAAAMVVLWKLLSIQGGKWLAAAGVVGVSFFPSAPLLQAAYSESLALLLLVTALYAATKDRWWITAVFVVALSFVRLISPPFALVGLYGVVASWKRGHRGARLAGPLAVTLLAVLGPFLWPLTARLFLDPEGASGASRDSTTLQGFGLGWFGGLYEVSPWLAVLPALLALAFVRFNWMPGTRRWGLPLRLWGSGYPVFVLLVTPPTTGFLRYLLLMLTLGLPLGMAGRFGRWQRIGILALAATVLMGLQVWWIENVFIVTETSYAP